jgi:hypothetical protein
MPGVLYQLWGGILDRVDIDLLQQRVVLDFHVINSTQVPPVRRHVAELGGVSEFRWFSSIPGPWNYADVTELHFRQTSTGSKVLDIMLWSEEAGISITASSATLDGEPIIREQT